MNLAHLDNAINNRLWQTTFSKGEVWVEHSWRIIKTIVEKYLNKHFHYENDHCLHIDGGPTIACDKFANTILVRDGKDVFEYQSSRDNELTQRIADIVAKGSN